MKQLLLLMLAWLAFSTITHSADVRISLPPKSIWNFSANAVISGIGFENETVFVQTDSTIYAINESTGKQIWSKSIQNCQTSIAKDRVILTDCSDKLLGVYAVDSKSGEEVWNRTLRGWQGELKRLTDWGWNVDLKLRTYISVASRLVSEDKLILTLYDYGPSERTVYIYALNPETGAELWEQSQTASGTPDNPSTDFANIIDKDFVYVNTPSMFIYDNETNAFLTISGLQKFDINNGSLLNITRLQRNLTSWYPTKINDVIFTKCHTGAWYGEKFCAINASDGSLIWEFGTGATGYYWGPGLFGGYGKVFLISDKHELIALNETTGKVVWEKPINCMQSSYRYDMADSFAGYRCSMLSIGIADHKVFVTENSYTEEQTKSGELMKIYNVSVSAFNESNGDKIWGYPMSEPTYSPYIYNDKIFLLSGSNVLAFGPECEINSDCLENETCSSSKCVPLDCGCGYPREHDCVSYECCNDSDCKGGVCNMTIKKCEPKTQSKEEPATKSNATETVGIKPNQTENPSTTEDKGPNQLFVIGIVIIVVIIVMFAIFKVFKGKNHKKDKRTKPKQA